MLKALLPETGTDIKGQMRSRQELLEASGYSNRLTEFGDLIRILDHEFRLITPTEAEGEDGGRRTEGGVRTNEEKMPDADSPLNPPSSVPAPFVFRPSLLPAHPRLSGSFLAGLADPQAEGIEAWPGGTAAGGSCSRVDAPRPENRQLPSLLQWFQIQCFTERKHWTAPQRKMMHKATGYHFVRGMALGLMLAALTIDGPGDPKPGRRTAAGIHAAELVQRVLVAETAQVPGIVALMTGHRNWTDPLLRHWSSATPGCDPGRSSMPASLSCPSTRHKSITFAAGSSMRDRMKFQ